METGLSHISPHVPAIIAIIGGVLIAIVAILAGVWRRMRQTEMEASLKHEMLTRGMSAEDIERVIKAGAPPEE